VSPKVTKIEETCSTKAYGVFLTDEGASIHVATDHYEGKSYASIEKNVRITDGGKTIFFNIRAGGSTATEILESARESEKLVAELIRQLQTVHNEFARDAADLAIKVGSDS
jgi:hypothetical protein